jgi:hypothetical protein
MSDNAKPKYVLWPYTPTIAAGVIAAIAFAAITGLHAWRLLKNRTWFCIPFVIGGLFETIGYAARAAAHNDAMAKTPYIIQSTLILVAPILFAASVYMILGRLILRTESASYSIIRATWVTKVFVTGDMLCFFIQAGGAGMLVSADNADGFKLGENIILGGLILQILIFAFFVVVASIWHRRLNAVPTAAAAELPWKKYISLLYGASVFITLRNLCRVIEYALGKVNLYINVTGERLTATRTVICSLTNGLSTSTISFRCFLHLRSALLGTIQISRPVGSRTWSSACGDEIRYARIFERDETGSSLGKFSAVRHLRLGILSISSCWLWHREEIGRSLVALAACLGTAKRRAIP